jgi:hypothetical protein
MDNPQFHAEVATIFNGQRRVLGVDIYPNPDRVGSAAPAVIEVTCWSTRQDTALHSVGVLAPADARALAAHLANAAGLVEQFDPEVRAGIEGVRLLPTITLCGRRFYIDERLRQLRNAENPDHYFDLVDPFTD